MVEHPGRHIGDTMTDKKQPKRRPISAARLYMAVTEFIESTDFPSDPTLIDLVDALEKAVVTEATR